MRKSSIRFLTVASNLLLIAVLAACTPDKTDDLPPYPDLALLDAEAGMAYPDSAAFDISTGTFDARALTLEQVLQRTRLAMGDIVTYKTRGTTVDMDSNQEFSSATRHFGESHSYDRYRFGIEYPEDEGGYFSEYLSVGSQVFSRNSRHGWQESSEPSSNPRTPVPPSQGFLSFLYEDTLVLVSDDEVTEDGVRVYRLGSIESFEHTWSGIPVSEIRTTSLLTDKATFRVVTRIIDKNYKRDYVGEGDSGSTTGSDWSGMAYTEHYYHYNEPVIIEVPDEYVPWSDGSVLSSALGPDVGSAR